MHEKGRWEAEGGKEGEVGCRSLPNDLKLLDAVRRATHATIQTPRMSYGATACLRVSNGKSETAKSPRTIVSNPGDYRIIVRRSAVASQLGYQESSGFRGNFHEQALDATRQCVQFLQHGIVAHQQPVDVVCVIDSNRRVLFFASRCRFVRYIKARRRRVHGFPKACAGPIATGKGGSAILQNHPPSLGLAVGVSPSETSGIGW